MKYNLSYEADGKRVEFDYKCLAKPITMSELKAICKKVEELGWN